MKTPKEALKELEWEATNEDSRIGRDDIDRNVEIIEEALINRNEEKTIREDEVEKFTKYFVDIIQVEKLSREEIISRLQSYHHKECTV